MTHAQNIPLLKKRHSLFPQLGFGLGLRACHYESVNSGRSKICEWFEVVSENYLIDGGRPLNALDKVRRDFEIAVHGVSLSLGSTDEINLPYLQKLKELIHRIEPAIVSDHCCWTRVENENLHDLLPLPFTQTVVQHMVDRIQFVQDYLGRRILLENVSSYITFPYSEMTEWEFLSEISERADCGLLLDVNNVFVSSINHGFCPTKFIASLPAHRIGQIHLAGHSLSEYDDGTVFLVDTHDSPVCDEVWNLFRNATRQIGTVSTMIERDEKIPQYAELENELSQAVRIVEEIKEDQFGADQTESTHLTRQLTHDTKRTSDPNEGSYREAV